MTDIEKKAYEAYPKDVNMVVVPSSGLTPIDSNEKYRDGYIKCAKEYESLPKIRGVVSYLFSPEIIEATGLKSEDEVELLIRKKQ